MNIALRKPMSLPEFLAWEARQDRAYEFDGFRPVAMTGGTAEHDRITFNIQKALDARLGDGPCRLFGPNVKIIAAGKVRYPDVLVTCSPTPRGATIIDDPILVFEVVSHDNQRTDRIDKVQDYRATPSIRGYVIVEQAFIGATVFTRQREDWIATTLREGGILQLSELGIELPLEECYAGLELARPSPETEA